ncbi:MAG: DUF1501 domain-containing protein [Verrucomicrobia bacterium]|nr:DUF1501 domain-containing protein [Verrucomicrobiota bacterium]
MPSAGKHSHSANHAFAFFQPRAREGLVVHSRRSVLKAGLAGLAGLTFPSLLRARSEAAGAGRSLKGNKSVILVWMTGGPSHIDTWDVKPGAPREIRGPFKDIPTKLPGVHICEYLPKQAAMLDKMTIIRSMDARLSNHEPTHVFQTGSLESDPRTNPQGHLHPAIGSIVAKFRGANHPGMPPYVALNMKSRSHLAWGGWLGKAYDPFNANNVGQLFQLPTELTMDRLQSRRSLREQMDTLRRDVDNSGAMEGLDSFNQQAFDMVAGSRAQEAFDLLKEDPRTVERYGSHDWARQALLARRLVERGVSFVTIDLSNHSASGTWDTHGDNIPPYGGIWNGLRPLLPVLDHVLTTLVGDIHERGLQNDVLVIAMGEFGRSPQLGTQGSTDGRNHWPYVCSATIAGGGFRHGQVIGASERDGGQIAERPVTPGDLAATIYHHMGVPLNTTYEDHQRRPRYIVVNGEPIRELI